MTGCSGTFAWLSGYIADLHRDLDPFKEEFEPRYSCLIFMSVSLGKPTEAQMQRG